MYYIIGGLITQEQYATHYTAMPMPNIYDDLELSPDAGLNLDQLNAIDLPSVTTINSVDDSLIDGLPDDLVSEVNTRTWNKQNGRPWQNPMTEKRANSIIELVRNGYRPVTACKSVGMGERYYRELHGRLIKHPGAYPLEEWLWEQIQQAQAQAQGDNEAVFYAAGKEDWKAALAWLERTDAKQWGKQPETVIVNSNNLTLNNIDELSDEQLLAIAQGIEIDVEATKIYGDTNY